MITIIRIVISEWIKLAWSNIKMGVAEWGQLITVNCANNLNMTMLKNGTILINAYYCENSYNNNGIVRRFVITWEGVLEYFFSKLRVT